MRSFRLQTPSTPQNLNPQILAVSCTLLAWFCSLILIAQAWIFALIFALAAITALRRPNLTRTNRIIPILCLILSGVLVALNFI